MRVTLYSPLLIEWHNNETLGAYFVTLMMGKPNALRHSSNSHPCLWILLYNVVALSIASYDSASLSCPVQFISGNESQVISYSKGLCGKRHRERTFRFGARPSELRLLL